MIIKFSKTFVKQRNKSPLKIRMALDERMSLFIENSSHPLLNIHKLHGNLKKYYSLNITGDWRVIFKIINENEIALFLMFGTHSKLYKK